MKTSHLFIILVHIFAFSLAVAQTQKTVCSITLNSNHEIELFKKHLSPLDWKFVELVPKNEDIETQNWMDLACKKKVTCDVLVISGHFGGTFFGTSKYKLTTEELESKSCDESCSGILHNPKEVFLFGCNTLAGKDKDHRSPQEYMQVLLNDGFTATQASQIVSFRYSEFGDSYKNRMSQVFAKVPRIYGFSSVGPSGKTIEPLLNRYLNQSKNEYKNLQSKNFSAETKNTSLFEALRNTKLVQTSGSMLNLKTVTDKPYCYIKDKQKTHQQKLSYISYLFDIRSAMNVLPHIQEYLHQLKENWSALTAAERTEFQYLTQNKKIKNELLEVLKLQGDVYIPIKAHVLNTLSDLSFVDKEFSNKSFVDLLQLNQPMTDSRKDVLCSMNSSFQIPADAIPQSRWNEMNFLVVLLCLKTNTTEIKARFMDMMKNHPDPAFRGTAVWYFEKIRSSDLNIYAELMKVQRNDSDEHVRKSAEMVLKAMFR